MNIRQINDGIYYAGVNDRTTTQFESLWSLPDGVSYNSYIVAGEKTALIDGVHISKIHQFIANINAITDNRPIDYMIINHMEPDHSGAIEILKSVYPNIKIVGNRKTADFLSGFYGITDNVIVVTDGEELDLGGKTLKFTLAPMVHWPETMITMETTTGTMFSGDAFGCYGALNGGVTDSEIDIEPYISEMYRYYATIVMKYGKFVQSAISKLKGSVINMICPTHGPVWQAYMMHVIDLYDRMSRYESEDGVVIVYGSMYGNTEEMADYIASQVTSSGYTNTKVYNLMTADFSKVLSDVCRYRGLIFGCPTYSNSIFPPMQRLLDAIVLRELKGKVFASFGEYSWGPGITKKMNSCVEHLGFDIVEPSVEVKQGITTKDLAVADTMVEEFIKRLKK